jgi:hypothetical protein
LSQSRPHASAKLWLALSVAVVGVAIWGLTRARPAEPAPAARPELSQAPAARAVEPAPPPPPPLESKLPSSEDRAQPKRTASKPVAVRAGSCDGACAGTASLDLQGSLRTRAGQARSCYERALAQNSSLTGSLSVNVRIGSSGEVCSVELGKDTLRDAAVSACVLQRFRTGQYPRPNGGCVDAAVPINFVPRQL